MISLLQEKARNEEVSWQGQPIFMGLFYWVLVLCASCRGYVCTPSTKKRNVFTDRSYVAVFQKIVRAHHFFWVLDPTMSIDDSSLFLMMCERGQKLAHCKSGGESWKNAHFGPFFSMIFHKTDRKKSTFRVEAQNFSIRKLVNWRVTNGLR